MLDPDISTHEALHHLTRPAPDDARSLDRRRFLQMVGMGLGAGAIAGPGSSLVDSFMGDEAAAWAAPVSADEGIVVMIGLFGGNDGLNTVVPTEDGAYRDQRSSIAIPGHQALRLDSSSGLHPDLTILKDFWDSDRLAIVEGVGHTEDEFSHFASLAKWMSGRPTGATTSGWVGRWLDRHLAGGPDLFAAAEIGTAVPLHMVGERSVATAVPTTAPRFGNPRSSRVEGDRTLFDSVRSIASDAAAGALLTRIGQAQADQLDLAAVLGGVIPSERPGGESGIVGQLEVAARLVNADLGFRVVSTGFGSFDSHAGQPSQHGARMRELNDGVSRFFATLDPRWAGRVTVMTFSEFGRTSHANDGEGTDHGSSGPQFVFGAGVKGGFYGQRPTLRGLGRWERMATHVDMRSYYASILDGWLGGGSSEILGADFEDLDLFATPPRTAGTVPPITPPPTRASTTPPATPPAVPDMSGPGVPASFVGVTPERLLDTRIGLGARKRRVGPGETVHVAIAGHGPVPTNATAVAVNITAVNPTLDTFITAYPTGQDFPDSSTLNPRPGIVTPNSTVVGLGNNGSVSIYNNTGTVDVLVDVMGYFVPTTTNKTNASTIGFHPLTPSRLLDTRNGNGAPKNRIPQQRPLTLQITGRGGVPPTGVDAVVINLVAVDPTAEGWIVAWPTSEPMPVVSNVQYQPHRTVPTLAVVKVGTNGRIDLMASAGHLDMIVDVVGYFATNGATMHPIAPQRLLDTRNGTGAPTTPIGPGNHVTINITGRAGVPTTATAAALNITAANTTHDTYLTIHPSNEQRPTTSSLNPDKHQISANLAITKLATNGTITIYNNHGTTDIIADLTAYFT